MSQQQVALSLRSCVLEEFWGHQMSDCRHVCDDEESHHEDLDEVDHVHEDHDDHCSASGTVSGDVFPFSLCNVLVSVVTPFVRRSDVNPLFIRCCGKFFYVGLRVFLFVHAQLVLSVLEVALLDRSVIFVSLRNPRHLLLS